MGGGRGNHNAFQNHQITTGIGGTFLGKSLFRMASLVLEKGDGPRFWREVGTSAELKRNEAQADFSMDYGLPGRPGSNYTRAFDYFAFQAAALSANLFENVMTCGLLFGKNYEAGKNARGVCGFYGS